MNARVVLPGDQQRLLQGLPGVQALHVGPWRLALVALDGIGALSAPPRFLTPDELQVWGRLRFEKRRREWLGGRLVAKAAVSDFLVGQGQSPPAFSAIPIHNSRDSHDRGRPQCPLAPFVSISHSHGFAVAVAASQPVGVDLERTRGFSPSAIDSVFTTEENDHINRLSYAQRNPARTLNWCCKEAVMKSIGRGVLGWFSDFELIAGHAGTETLQWRCSRRLQARLPGKPRLWSAQVEDYSVVLAAMDSQQEGRVVA